MTSSMLYLTLNGLFIKNVMFIETPLDHSEWPLEAHSLPWPDWRSDMGPQDGGAYLSLTRDKLGISEVVRHHLWRPQSLTWTRLSRLDLAGLVWGLMNRDPCQAILASSNRDMDRLFIWRSPHLERGSIPLNPSGPTGLVKVPGPVKVATLCLYRN